jgi:hypothetical protein
MVSMVVVYARELCDLLLAGLPRRDVERCEIRECLQAIVEFETHAVHHLDFWLMELSRACCWLVAEACRLRRQGTWVADKWIGVSEGLMRWQQPRMMILPHYTSLHDR